jgi:hypothetical protein
MRTVSERKLTVDLPLVAQPLISHYCVVVYTINLLRLLSLGENNIRNGRFSTTEELDKKVAAILEPPTGAQCAALR